MKFTTLLLLAAVASVMVEATPLATPQDTCRISCRREMCQAIKECREHCPADCPLKAEEAAPVEPKVEARDDCKKCDDFYNKCRGSPWCWLNPYGCDVSCRADTCRKNGDDCKNKCGYQC